MTAWKTTLPPVGLEILYERDDGTVERGVLERFGLLGANASGKESRMRPQFKRKGVAEMFEVRRWRELKS